MTRDLIDAHVAALGRVLRGPRRTRRCMLAEVRDGLRDAEDAYRAAGLDPEAAVARAVRDFGPVDQVAPAFQDELTARQGRWAAVLFAIVFPSMLVAWDLLWASGVVRDERVAPPPVVGDLAALQDVVTTLVGVTALALFAGTFHRGLAPRPLARAIGLTGSSGALVCAGLTVAMNLAGGRTTLTMLAENAAMTTAFATSGVVLVLLVWQAVRTLRVAGTS